MMTVSAAQNFAVWLLNTHPDLFFAIAKKNNPGLSGISDIFSNIGGAFSSAVSSVGNWVSNPQNVQALTGLASTYFASKAASNTANAQLAVLKTQLDRAQVGQAPAPITYTTDAGGNLVPVYTGAPATLPALGSQMILPSGQIGYQVSPQALQSLQPGFLQKYGTLIGVGGVALVALFILMR